MDHGRRLIDHESRLIKVEILAGRLDEHHKNDKLLEKITDLQTDVAVLQSKKNGNGNAPSAVFDKRLRWVERIAFGALGAIGGVAAVDWLKRVFH